MGKVFERGKEIEFLHTPIYPVADESKRRGPSRAAERINLECGDLSPLWSRQDFY
jgi:hypothetical protein